MKPLFENVGFNIPKVLGTAAGLVILLIVLVLILPKWHKPSVGDRFQLLSPRSQVEFEDGTLVRALRNQQQQELQRYRWQNDQHQFAEVPIERAMEAIVKGQAQGRPR